MKTGTRVCIKPRNALCIFHPYTTKAAANLAVHSNPNAGGTEPSDHQFLFD